MCNGLHGGNNAEAGLGIPLGGVGAGNFMINQAGTFGPWSFGDDAGAAEERILSQAAFHIRTQTAGAAARTQTLAVNSRYGSVLPAWHTLNPGQGRYSALYPFGWIRYKGLATGVSMRFWSPIVARSDYYTSMPVAYFDLRLTNPSSKTQHVSTMFTFPNATEHSGTNYQGPTTIRAGLSSRYHFDRRSHVAGVTLSSSSPSNTADAKDSEWTIATQSQAGQTISYTTSWNASGDGSDVYTPFEAAGVLPDRPLDSSASAGALAVSTVLHPHRSTVVRFILSWDFPQVTYGSSGNTVWMRRYTAFFGSRETSANSYVPGSYPFHQSFTIADRLLAEHRQALQAVSRWWLPIATNPKYPAWLRTAALNEIYYVPWGGSFWESGLVSSTDTPAGGRPRIGSQVPGTHLFFDLEGGGFNDANCWDCDAYGHTMDLQLFPTMTRDLLRGWTSMILEDPNGATPHDAGSTDPWIQWSPTSGPAISNTKYADEPAKHIFRAWEYYRATHDKAFFAFVYPAMIKTLGFVQAHILPGDHLPLDGPFGTNTYDTWPMQGHGVYDCELYLLALEADVAATKQALALHIPTASTTELNSLSSELPLAKQEFESDFWDGNNTTIGPHYRIDTGASDYSDGVMADALLAQHFAEELGLPDVVTTAHILPHLKTATPLLTQFRDTSGQPTGVANGVNDLGQEIYTADFQGHETWVGVSWMYAATAYDEGKRFHNLPLRQQALAAGRAIYHQIYQNLSNGYSFDDPEAWADTDTHGYRGASYLRPRAVWELLNAIDPPQIPTPIRPARPAAAR